MRRWLEPASVAILFAGLIAGVFVPISSSVAALRRSCDELPCYQLLEA